MDSEHPAQRSLLQGAGPWVRGHREQSPVEDREVLNLAGREGDLKALCHPYLGALRKSNSCLWC